MKWPTQVVIVRHGQSEFNILRDKKELDPLYQEFRKAYETQFDSDYTRRLAMMVWEKYRLNISDYETRLTEKGVEQARITGSGLNRDAELPDAVYVSPYLRTRQTFEAMAEAWPELSSVKMTTDDRIREQEHGMQILYNDWRVFHVFHPEQKRMRDLFGLYWFQYPQGESMADVRRRVGSFLATLIREHAGQRVLLVTHHVTILCFRAAVERLTPEQLVDMDVNLRPVNCGVTSYRGNPFAGQDGHLELVQYNKKYYTD